MRECLLRDMSTWGCLPRRVSAYEGVSPEGYVCLGGCLPRGVSA